VSVTSPSNNSVPLAMISAFIYTVILMKFVPNGFKKLQATASSYTKAVWRQLQSLFSGAAPPGQIKSDDLFEIVFDMGRLLVTVLLIFSHTV
jgi:hypothetical protein